MEITIKFPWSQLNKCTHRWCWYFQYNIFTVCSHVLTTVQSKRHFKYCEIYVSVKIFSILRSKTLIEHVFMLGICILYSRILAITKDITDFYPKCCRNFYLLSLLKIMLILIHLQIWLLVITMECLWQYYNFLCLHAQERYETLNMD